MENRSRKYFGVNPRLFLAGLALGVTWGVASAQELKCDVDVNYQKVESPDQALFEGLKQSISEYMNETKFSNATFSPVEKVECRLFLTVSSYDGDRVKGDLQVQLTRPVYNSTYTTTLINFKDSKIDFEYHQGDPLIFNENGADTNLGAILDFYAYLFLGVDFDSFSPNGGQPFFDRASQVVQRAQSSGEVGWKAFEDTKNRSAVLSVYTDANTAPLRKMNYDYHRRGLDEMVTSPDKGRAVITEAINAIGTVYDVAPMSVALSMFRDAKLDELVNIYSKGTQTERDQVYDLLIPIYPADRDRIEKIKQPDSK